MARKKPKTVQYRRKRQGRTDYRKRLSLLMSGKPRLVARRSAKHMLVQVVQHDVGGDRVVVSAHTKELAKLGWKHATGNLPAAYLAGYMAGRKAISSGIKEAVFDIGLQAKAPRLFAVLKGALDAGMAIPHGERILPDEKRLFGSHIADYSKTNKNPVQFSSAKENDNIAGSVRGWMEKIK